MGGETGAFDGKLVPDPSTSQQQKNPRPMTRRPSPTMRTVLSMTRTKGSVSHRHRVAKTKPAGVGRGYMSDQARAGGVKQMVS
jgi:hypothetical protein